MLQILETYWVTIVVLTVVLLIVFFAVRSIIKSKKAGVGPCGCKCSECPHACSGRPQ